MKVQSKALFFLGFRLGLFIDFIETGSKAHRLYTVNKNLD